MADIVAQAADVTYCGFSESTFNTIRKDDMYYLKIRKYKAFGKCDDCEELKKLIRESTGYKRASAQVLFDQHQEWQLRERKKSAKHRLKAMTKGQTNYIWMEIDGMDHSKCGIGKPAVLTKATAKTERLETHCTGVHVAISGKLYTYAVTWYDRFPTGSDSIMTCVIRIIEDIEKMGLDMPPVLYLHADNCGRENKNRSLPFL